MFKKINNLIAKIKGNNFWKSVAALSSGQIIAQLINLFSVPIISRIYSKESYGDFGIIISTATIIIGFIGMGLGSAIMAPKTDEESEKVFRTSFSIQFVLSFVLCLGFLILMPYYQFFTSQIPYPVAILIMFVYINLTVLSSLMNIYINRLKMTKVLFLNPLIGALVTLLVTLPLGLLGLDAVGLYIASIISYTIINIHMLRKANPFTKKPSFAEMQYIIKKYRHFIIYQYPSNLMTAFTSQMPNQLLSSNFGNSALGDYSMCNKIFTMPISLIAAPIQTIYFRTVTQKYRDGEDIADFTFSLITKLMLLSIIPIIILMAFGEPIFSFILGDQWRIAGKLASILALQYVFTFCNNCITYCRVTINKQKINLLVSLFQAIIIIISLIIGVSIFKTLIGTITCFAIASTVYNIIDIFISFRCLKKYSFKFLIISFIYCLICILFTSVINIWM
ncbi:MAG: oligosaccharide flippase family protein [Clostridia bacterium]